jgi:uncharacterized protein YejL (UPF0352 family)
VVHTTREVVLKAFANALLDQSKAGTHSMEDMEYGTVEDVQELHAVEVDARFHYVNDVEDGQVLEALHCARTVTEEVDLKAEMLIRLERSKIQPLLVAVVVQKVAPEVIAKSIAGSQEARITTFHVRLLPPFHSASSNGTSDKDKKMVE